MQGQKIKGILIDTAEQSQNVIEITDDLEEFYRVLNCGLIDIVSRTIGGKCYDIVCDDEGNFKEELIATAYGEDGRAMFVGNIFICTYAGGGELGSLSEDDIEHILSRTIYDLTFKDGKVTRCQPVITEVGYP